MENDYETNIVVKEDPKLTEEIQAMLEKQNSRIVSEFKALKLEKEAQKNWDLFYKRNETRFFKDRWVKLKLIQKFWHKACAFI